MIVEARAASTAAVVNRVAFLDSLTDCIDAEARELLPAAHEPSPLTAAGVVGGLESLLYSRLAGERTRDLDDLLPSLMYFAVLPYEGHDAANEALAAS